MIPSLVEQLPRFTVKLLKNGNLVGEGSGRSPAEPLATGELVSSGTLTESQPIAPGETWTAVVEGLSVPALTLTT